MIEELCQWHNQLEDQLPAESSDYDTQTFEYVLTDITILLHFAAVELIGDFISLNQGKDKILKSFCQTTFYHDLSS